MVFWNMPSAAWRILFLPSAQYAFSSIATDQSIRYQQNLRSRRIAILGLTSNDWIRIRRVKEQIAVIANSTQVGEYREFVIKP